MCREPIKVLKDILVCVHQVRISSPLLRKLSFDCLILYIIVVFFQLTLLCIVNVLLIIIPCLRFGFYSRHMHKKPTSQSCIELMALVHSTMSQQPHTVAKGNTTSSTSVLSHTARLSYEARMLPVYRQ